MTMTRTETVSDLDSFVGMSVYLTASRGIGGQIRQQPKDFVVNEVYVEPRFRRTLSTSQSHKDRYRDTSLGARPVTTLSLIHISEPTRRTPISYAVFCLKKKKKSMNI